MNHVRELKRREQLLREKVRQTPASEFGVLPEHREWIVDHLSGMKTLFDLHVDGIRVEDREYEEYRLSFLLPLYSYLSRAYDLYNRESASVAR